MPKYRVEVVFVCRHWTAVEVEAASAEEAADLVADMTDLTPEHLDEDPEIEINVIGEASRVGVTFTI